MLPNELWLKIVLECTTRSILRLRLVSREWKNFIHAYKIDISYNRTPTLHQDFFYYLGTIFFEEQMKTHKRIREWKKLVELKRDYEFLEECFPSDGTRFKIRKIDAMIKKK